MIFNSIMCSILFSLLGFSSKQKNIPKSIYDFKIKSIKGENISFENFKGKKILLVNVASKCGFTPQYDELEKLYQTHKNNLVIIGFPANNFLFQEPGSNKQIAEFCEINYGVSFYITEKISVRGFSKHPIYQWLTNKKYNSFADSKVKWNFQKYLINENGNLEAIFDPKTKPLSKEILEKIETK